MAKRKKGISLDWRVVTRQDALNAPPLSAVVPGTWSGIVWAARDAWPDCVAVSLPKGLVGKNVVAAVIVAATRDKISIRTKLSPGVLYVWRDSADATRRR